MTNSPSPPAFQDRAIHYTHPQTLEQLIVRNRVEVTLQVRVVHFPPSGLKVLPNDSECIQRRTARTETVRTVDGVRLEDRFHHQQHRRCTIRSLTIGIPRGRCRPSGLGMYTRLTGRSHFLTGRNGFTRVTAAGFAFRGFDEPITPPAARAATGNEQFPGQARCNLLDHPGFS